MSSLTINIDILKLKKIAMNKNYELYLRKGATERITTIPHRDKNKHIIECLMSLVSDDKYDINARYSLFSNNKLYENEVLNSLHQFYFHNFNPPRYNIRYKILSAQYILTNINKNQFDLRDIQGFLIRTGRDQNIDSSIRTECVDILKRTGHYSNDDFNYEEFLNRPFQPTIVPEPRRRILVMRRTVYEDSQNVHSTSINESVKETIKQLYKEYSSILLGASRVKHLNEISKRITQLSKELNNDIVRQRIIGSFDRIMIDTAKFEHELSLADILILIWNKIKSSKDKDEMEKRLIEEMIDMNGLCATGHLSRLINVMSGFYEGVLKISYKDQIKNYVYNHYNKVLEKHENQEVILNEMTEDSIDKKPNIIKMIETMSNKHELYIEFVNSKLVSENEFNEYYKYAVDSYCGIL
jgi:hypothetical protein